MTTPQEQFVDTANALLAQVPAMLLTGTIDVPGEPQKGVVTIRTASTTVTVILDAGDVTIWATALAKLKASLTSLVASAIEMPAPGNGRGRP